jgi:hypothetical protein
LYYFPHFYRTEGLTKQMWPPQYGPGKLFGVGRGLVADRRLGSTGAVLGVVAAAATLATTTVRAKMRRASFIVGNLVGL